MPKNQEVKLEKIRHSLAHILAAAVQELYPGVKFGIGPAIKNGFYYDFDFSNVSKFHDREKMKPKKNVSILNDRPKLKQNKVSKISPEDLPRIEKKMRELIKKDLKFEKKEISIEEAKKILKNQPYKLNLITEITQDKYARVRPVQVSIYQVADFVDLCKGPHVESIKEINPKAFKLTKLAGAYWRGDEKNPMLTRIYGLAFGTEKELNDYLKQLREAEKRDHRKLGLRLDLFSFHDEAPGMAFWHNKGLIIWRELVKYWQEEHKKAGYEEISTPLILKEDLWHTSRHMQTYQESMYFSEIDKQKYVIKPMNCPGGLLLYKEKPHSYRELPLRVAELGLVHRHELAGVLHGLFRVRAFTQDDAHIYCTKEQVEDEIKGVINLTLKFYKTFGFRDFHLELSTRPEKYTGTPEMWNLAEKILEKVLKETKLDYKTNPGDGAFYGPKIDFHLKDSIGRTWQCGTIQLDFAQPENFELEYIDKKGKKQRPVMLHRTIYGSLERFIGVLIEHYAGALPNWLSPAQAWLIPVGSNHRKYAEELTEKLKAKGLRVEAKIEAETVSKKIREGEIQKIPYLLVVGDKEIERKSVRVRQRGKGDIGEMKLNKFLEKITQDIEKRSPAPSFALVRGKK